MCACVRVCVCACVRVCVVCGVWVVGRVYNPERESDTAVRMHLQCVCGVVCRVLVFAVRAAVCVFAF